MLKTIIENLKKQELLIPCKSPCNILILGLKKSNDKRTLVQDLHMVNEAVVPLHPMVPNPYTLLYTITEQEKYFSACFLELNLYYVIPYL